MEAAEGLLVYSIALRTTERNKTLTKSRSAGQQFQIHICTYVHSTHVVLEKQSPATLVRVSQEMVLEDEPIEGYRYRRAWYYTKTRSVPDFFSLPFFSTNCQNLTRKSFSRFSVCKLDLKIPLGRGLGVDTNDSHFISFLMPPDLWICS